MILVIATQFRTQPPILLGQWRMAVLPTPCPYPFHKPAKALPDCLPLDDPVSTACFGPIVGKSEKVECPCASGRVLAPQRLIERNQRRLFGMNGEVVVYLSTADKYYGLTRRPSQEQKGLDERTLMASQRPFHPW